MPSTTYSKDADVISEDRAHALVDPHLPLLGQCLEAGWLAWTHLGASAAGLRLPISNSGRARIVHDHCVFAAEQIFGVEQVPGVRPVRVHGLYALDFHGELLIRFKKFTSASFGICGIPTQQKLDFDAQRPLDGTDATATKAVAGYILNFAQTNIDMLALTCALHGVAQWTIEIPRQTAVVVPFPLAAAAQTLPAADVRSARGASEEEKEKGS